MYTQVTVAAVGVWSPSKIVGQERNKKLPAIVSFLQPVVSFVFLPFFSEHFVVCSVVT